MKGCFRYAFMAAVLSAVVLLFGIACVHAFFTASSEAVNTVDVGFTEAAIEEEFSPEVLGSEKSKSEGIRKVVNIRNTGNGPCAVRVRADFSDSEMKEKVDIDWDRDLWEESSDGFWYYRGTLLSEDDKKTGYDDTVTIRPLFTRVKLLPGISEAEISDFDIYIRAESINCGPDERYEDIEW